jgi:5,10-methylenetetrahydrofolate reductase
MGLREAFDSGRFVVTAELRPSCGVNGAGVREAAARLKGSIDAAVVTDNGGATLGLSALAAATLARREGLPVVLTLSCRDRNRLALQSELLGAAALDVTDVLCVSGDHPRLGSQPDSRPVFDLDSVQLLQAARSLMGGQGLGGEPIEPAPAFHLGAVVNPVAQPATAHLAKLDKKVRAGASFVVTQAIFDLKPAADVLRAARELGLKVLAGVRVLSRADIEGQEGRQAPGPFVPGPVAERIRLGGNGGLDEGIALAAELVKAVYMLKAADGVHLTGIAGREEVVPLVLKRAGL